MRGRKLISLIAIMLIALVSWSLAGCGGGTEMADNTDKTDFTVGTGSTADSISEFYYTFENINYNAEYLRYLFYIEDSVPYFYYEKRERPNDYGPTTEEDIVAQGTVKLNEEQWSTFSSFIEEGSYGPRKDNAESGSSGPWTYIYFRKAPKKQLEFKFASWDRLAEFEEFCAKIAGLEKQDFRNTAEDAYTG